LTLIDFVVDIAWAIEWEDGWAPLTVPNIHLL